MSGNKILIRLMVVHPDKPKEAYAQHRIHRKLIGASPLSEREAFRRECMRVVDLMCDFLELKE